MPACVVVVMLMLHAVHADHATTYHFEKHTGIWVHDSAVEHQIDECVEAAERSVRTCCAMGGTGGYQRAAAGTFLAPCGWPSLTFHVALALRDLPRPSRRYQQLGQRLQRRLEQLRAGRQQSGARLGETREAELAGRFATGLLQRRGPSRQASMASRFSSLVQDAVAEQVTYSGYLLKTPSSRGPATIIRSTALASPTAAARSDLLTSAPANSPTTRRWWVLRGAEFKCYNAEEDWRAELSGGLGAAGAKLAVDLRAYTVVECRDVQGTPTIALLPKVRGASPAPPLHELLTRVSATSLCSRKDEIASYCFPLLLIASSLPIAANLRRTRSAGRSRRRQRAAACCTTPSGARRSTTARRASVSSSRGTSDCV